MRFLLSVLSTTTEHATPEEHAAIDVFNQGLHDRGQLVAAEGLTAPSEAVVVDNRGGKGEVTSGPYATGDEFLMGFWIIDVASREEALQYAHDGSKACNRRVEVRAFPS